MIAIHIKENSFSDRWIKYCEKNSIDFIGVNIYDTNIIQHLLVSQVKYLLSQPSLEDHKTKLISRSILFSIENVGIEVYPNHNTFWHYDDKISQKYLFESKQLPHARMHVFYNISELKHWISVAAFPFVFKLRGGAGSANVFLLKNKKEAKKYLRRMFGKGMKPHRSAFNDLKTKVYIHSTKKDWVKTILRIPNTLNNLRIMNTQKQHERSYFLVQEFLPGNKFDTRVVVVGNKAFAFRRFNRPGDFKASGSGNHDLSQQAIDLRAIKLAFQATIDIKSQSLAVDILFNQQNNPLITEISYLCPAETINRIGGFWDNSLVFHKASIQLEDAILESVLGIT